MSKKRFTSNIIIGLSLIFLTNCQLNNEENIEVEPEKLPSPLTENDQEAIEPGSYCFETQKEPKTTTQLLIAADYSVTGVIENSQTSQNKQDKNNLEYREFVAGILEKNELQVMVNREKDSQNQTRKETWLLTPKLLKMNQVIYNPINCENLINK
jgi:hypothetical protein